MLVVLQVLQQVNKHLWVGLLQLLFTHDVGAGIALSIHTVLGQRTVVTTLVFLGIIALFENLSHHLIVSSLVSLYVLPKILQQLEGFGHVFAKTIQ